MKAIDHECRCEEPAAATGMERVDGMRNTGSALSGQKLARPDPSNLSMPGRGRRSENLKLKTSKLPSP